MADQVQLQKDWESRILRAKSVREEWAKEFKVDLARKYFRGIQNPGWNQNEWITINKIYSHVRDILPTLYSIDPFFYVKLKRSFSPNPLDVAMFEQRGKIRQAYLNYLKKEVDLKSRVRLAICDALFEYGVIKSHYSAEQRENPDAGNPMRGENGEGILLDDNAEPLIEPETIPINERYNATRVHPKDLIWDEDAGPLDDKWNWIAERILLTEDDAEKDPRIKKAILEETAPASQKDRQRSETSQRGIDRLFKGARSDSVKGKRKRPGEDEKVWVAWEIYDLKANKWLKIVEDAREPIIEPQDLPVGMERHPYSFLRFVLLDDTAYPLPPLSQAIDPQKEYSTARSQVLRHRKRFNRKYEVVQSALLDESEATKLEVGEDGTFVFVKQLGAISPIKDAPLDQASYLEIQALSNDMTEILGSPGAEGLVKADSATQASLLDKRLDVREGDDLATVVDFTIDIGKKLDQLVQANITRDEAVKVTGPQGEFWELVKVSDFEEIDGEFEYSVNVGATLPRLPQIERAQLLALLQVLASFPHAMTSPALMKHLAEIYRIDNDSLIEELMKIGQQIISGQVVPPGGAKSTSGVPQDNPIAAILGAATGDQGGIASGGGAPGL